MQYIILLRGINVGGRTIQMDELKACFKKGGYDHVVTVLQTGNVILESKEKNTEKLQKSVESLLGGAFNYPARVIVITPGQLASVIAHYPFTKYGTEYHRYACFTEKGMEKELVKQAGSLENETEDILAGEAVIYWRVLKGHTLDSTFGKFMAKAATKHFLTTRNLNTLEKTLAKCTL